MTPTHPNLAIWQGAFSDLPLLAREAIKAMIEPQNPPVFADFMVDLFDRTAQSGTKARWVDANLITRAVTTPLLCPLPDAIRLARAAARVDSRLDSKLVRHLSTPSRDWPESASDADIQHVLEVIDVISDCERLVHFLLKFAKASHPHLKSKAVKLIARACRSPEWAKVILSDPDSRTRANLMEGLGLQTGAHVEPLLRQGAADPDPRVSLNALLALSRKGDKWSQARIGCLAHDSRPDFRRAAEWALKQIQRTPDAFSPATSVPHLNA